MDCDADSANRSRDHADDVLVLEREDPWLAIEQLDLRLAEVREDRRVLAADDAGTDDREALRRFAGRARSGRS